MPSEPLPCCHGAAPQHLVDLPHVYQFDFDLYHCPQCARDWVYAWREGLGGWEPVTAEDAQTMRSLDGAALRAFLKTWAQSFH